MFRAYLVGFTLLVLVTVGCRKRSPSAPVAAEQSSTGEAQPAAAPQSTQPAPATAPAASSSSTDKAEDRLPTAPPGSYKTNPVDMKLTEALQRHVEATGKMPADFNALVTGKYISKLPPPPPGKRFAVDRANLQVVLLGQ